MMLSGSSSSGGVGVGVGFRRGCGGGAPNVGAMRSVDGRVVCGGGVGGDAGVVVGGVGLGVCVLRGRSCSRSAKTGAPNTSPETIKTQTASIPVRLTLCSLNNGKLL